MELAMLMTTVGNLLASIDTFLSFLSDFGASLDNIRGGIYNVLNALDKIVVRLRRLIRLIRLKSPDLDTKVRLTLSKEQMKEIHSLLPLKCAKTYIDLSKLARSATPVVSLPRKRWPSGTSAQYSIRELKGHKRALSQCLRVIKS